MTLLNTFIRNGFCPTVIRNGRKILVIELKAYGLRFITSNTYFDLNEYELANQYNIPFEKIYFPSKFFDVSYEGVTPDLTFFTSPMDTMIECQFKKSYVLNLQSKNYKWNFQKELVQYCEQKLWLLTLSCLKFLGESFIFENQLNTILHLSTNQKLHPFSYPLCSLGGYVYKLFKIYFLNHENIHIVKNEFGTQSKNVSKIEFEWASFMNYLHPEKKFQYAFSNVDGQKYFKEAIPDLYSPITKQAYFFQGCVFHGHYENCLINSKANELTKTPFGRLYKEINEEFEEKMSHLLNNNVNQVHEVIIRWECHYREIRKSPPAQHFLNTAYVPHPLFRLHPRTCVRGAYFDVFALRWSKLLFPNEKLFFLDVNGLYSYCAINFKFMTGKYIILIGKTLDEISLSGNKFLFQGNQIMGSILLTILPPKNLFYPFLLYRTKNGKTVNTLCRLCAENQSKICRHSDSDRALTSCYMISEIEYALGLGYKVLAIHECHIYVHSGFILKEFVQYLNFF